MTTAKDPKKKPAKKAPVKKAPAKKAQAKKTPAKKVAAQKAQPKAKSKTIDFSIGAETSANPDMKFDIKITMPDDISVQDMNELAAPVIEFAKDAIEDAVEEQVAKVRRRFFSFFKKTK